jgi:hypothetical protein
MKISIVGWFLPVIVARFNKLGYSSILHNYGRKEIGTTWELTHKPWSNGLTYSGKKNYNQKDIAIC